MVACLELLCGEEGVQVCGRSGFVDVGWGWTCDCVAGVVMWLCARGGCVFGQVKLACGCAVDMVQYYSSRGEGCVVVMGRLCGHNGFVVVPSRCACGCLPEMVLCSCS